MQIRADPDPKLWGVPRFLLNNFFIQYFFVTPAHITTLFSGGGIVSGTLHPAV